MADFSSFTSKFKVRTNSSHELPASKVTKRPRLVCNQCQRSKLRCDRAHPCGNCVRRDEAAACSYQRSTGTRPETGRSTVVEDRLLHMESMVKQLMQNQALPQNGFSALPRDGAGQPEERSLKAAEQHPPRIDQTENGKYVGSTHWSAILDDIHELKTVLGSPADGHEDEEEHIAFEAPEMSHELIFGSPKQYNLQQIISQYLPSKVETERFLSTYFQGETYIVPFIHTYHFQRQYRDFWADTANANPLWLSMLFSVCYMACMIGSATGSSPTPQEELVSKLSAFHTAAGQCLVLGQYYRPQPFTVEALAMYAHCKNLRTLDPSREAGAILGLVVRMAYEMGYHRDPDSFGTFTVFEGEMRRRLWAACKQMDLMISFQLGLPSNIRLEHSDTRSPRNFMDSDFDADTKVLPPSRPENEPTKLLWFIVKERQIIGFSKVCQDALSFKEKSDVDILTLDQEIREMHTTIPEVLRTRPFSESIADPPFLIMTRLYVDFIHLKSLCVLHRKYMARGNIFSTLSCVDAGTKLVSQFIDMYNEFSPGGQLYTERWMLTNFTMNDFLLGVMVLCLVVHTRWKRGSQNSAIDTAMEKKVLELLEQSYTICIEKSTASRDARRVSHAVRLTLDGTKAPSVLTDSVTPVSQVPSEPTTERTHSLDPAASILLPPWNVHMQSDEEVFGFLDPFNFMGNDIENVDWSMFEAPI